LEPIFEADFLDCSYGFRPGRSAHQALEAIQGNLAAGYREVYDADLQGYFDAIPHDKLMACLRMRIADRSVLQLVRLWLEAVVVEADEAGKTRDTDPSKERRKEACCRRCWPMGTCTGSTSASTARMARLISRTRSWCGTRTIVRHEG
jgi:hypothetical protein